MSKYDGMPSNLTVNNTFDWYPKTDPNVEGHL